MLEQKRFAGRHLLTFESQKLNYFGKKSGAGVLTLAHRHLFLVIFFYLDTIYIYSILVKKKIPETSACALLH